MFVVQLRDLVPPEVSTTEREALYPRDSDGVFKAPGVPQKVPILLLMLSWRWTIQLMTQSARGLAQCHAVGMLHRDFTSWNQMFDLHWRLKVIDFGFAKKLGLVCFHSPPSPTWSHCSSSISLAIQNPLIVELKSQSQESVLQTHVVPA